MKFTLRLAVLAAVVPVVARAQILRGLAEVSTDTVRHGVFLETAGVGGLFALSYEHHFGPVITQIGFTRWSIHLLPAGPTRANKAAIGSILREFSAEWLFDRTSLEVGSGLAAGYHVRDAWAEPGPADSLLGPPASVERIRGRYVAMTGLVGLRFKPAIAHDVTFRLGWVPILRLRDQADATPYLRATIALSVGYTW
jgi:hypothetical protein